MKKTTLILSIILLPLFSKAQLINTVNTTDWNKIEKSGFFQSDASVSTNLPKPASTHAWYWGINIAHTGNYFGGQIAFGINYAEAYPSMYVRSTTQAGKGIWAKVLHDQGDQTVNGSLVMTGSDLAIRCTRRGNNGLGRALVHDEGNKLTINYAGDFTGGVDIQGPELNISGKTNITSGRIYLKNAGVINGANNSYLEYGGHNLHVGSPIGLPTDNILLIKPGGAAGQLLRSNLVMYDALAEGGHQSKINLRSNGVSYFNGGNVGIGTTTPQQLLDVNGTIKARQSIELAGQISYTLSNNFSYKDKTFGHYAIGWNNDTWNNQGPTLWQSAFGGIKFFTAGVFRMAINSSGNVGIGTEAPQAKLDVRGTVRAEKVEVKITDGADFVFQQDYNLRPLSEVESFIRENKHLPEIQSEKQMQQEGLDMSEFQIKLLQKVEELTLYAIELNKKTEIQQQENKAQKELIRELKNRLEKLEKND